MLIDLSVVIITFGSLIAAFVNAAFATGGVYILLASGSAVFPMTVAVPLMPLLAFASLVARVFFFLETRLLVHCSCRFYRLKCGCFSGR